MKYRVWRVKCDLWNAKCRLGLHCNVVMRRLYIYIQGKNVPRWRTAHASFIGEQHLYNPRAPPCLASGTTGQSLFFVDAEIPF